MLGELRTWAVCSFLPFREEEKKSFHYLVFDSDDSFLFLLSGSDFYKLF